MNTNTISKNEKTDFWFTILKTSLKIPGAKIEREYFLRKQFSRYLNDSELKKVIETSPSIAGVSNKIIGKVANSCINWQTAQITGLSFLAGIPGGWAMAATIPADLTQFYFQSIQLIQKLAYLYGWSEIFDAEEDGTVSDESLLVLSLFFGVMFGSSQANKAIMALSENMAKEVVKRLPQKALTKYGIYNISKEVGKWIGLKVTKDSFALSVSKSIPILGGVISGGISLATMKLMSNKLIIHLKELPQATVNEIENSIIIENVEEVLEADNKDFLELEKIKCLINLMKVDKEIHPQEEKFILNIIEKSEIAFEKKITLIDDMKSVQFLNIDFKLLKSESFESISLITILLELSKIDGNFDLREKLYIKEISKQLDIENEVNELLN
ncbi:tellurite resistance TerB family protein [Flammeovirga pacifica]|uniref:Co-chaperone DjlA N-terminal domain-containing protein n=1 Tax=Flammeovirga pacifica TaxID=915059 RepID=A0A1S1YTG6_FLAPC|nr:TerB family tellurite resistance protein [Flammeovirga pacifica]OHX64322.1 hypothetical protein NH26_22265 [Flammeovirga pacifica]